MNDSRDNLSTADLAGQTPERTERDGYDEPDRSADPVRDETESYRADDSVGVADDATGSAGDPAYDEPAAADYDGDTTGASRADHDRDTDDLDQRSAPVLTTEDAGPDVTGDATGDDSGPGPVRTDVPPADTSTVDTSAATSTVDTPVAGSTVESTTEPLLGSADSEGFRARWTGVQTGFVDAPREAVQKADALVAELMQHLAAKFADERGKLEKQWDRGDDVPTDDLRDAFQHYRSFFERLLSA